MTTPYQQRNISDPLINVGDEPYFAAAAEGRLLLKKCADCGEVHHYPRSACPFCLSDNVAWQDAKGTGKIYSYSITRRVDAIPYCIAYVTLDEGVTLMTNIVDCDLDQVSIEQSVKVAFKKTTGGVSVPMFTPLSEV